MKRFIIMAAAAAGGCGEAPQASLQPVVRDSAGVVIVESTDPVWTNNTRWRIERRPSLEIAISEDEPEQSPLDPVSVFRAPSGDIVVADGNQVGWHRIFVFDSAGRYVRHFGRRGEGPCEFRQVWWAKPYAGDSIAVFDMAKRVVHVFSHHGECAFSIRVPETHDEDAGRRMMYVNGAYDIYPDGSVLGAPGGTLPPEVGVAPVTHNLLRIARDGTIEKDYGRFAIAPYFWDGRRPENVHFGARAVRALDGDDLIYGDGSRYELTRRDSSGALVMIVRRAWVPTKISDGAKRDALSMKYLGGGGERASTSPRPPSLDRRIAESHWAEHMPPYSDLIVDDEGNLWVENFRTDSPGFEVREAEAVWTVFAKTGEWLGDVALPGSFFLTRIDGGMLFGTWQDRDGVRTVRGYRLIKTP